MTIIGPLRLAVAAAWATAALACFAGRPAVAQGGTVQEAAVDDPQSEAGANTATESLETFTERGPVTARLRLTPSQPQIGDALTLTLEVTSKADVEVLMPAFGQSLERFPIVDFAPREIVEADGSTTHRQTYTLRAQASGDGAIPPLSIEFIDHREDMPATPEGEDAYELLTDKLRFEIASVVPDSASAELAPPLGALARLGGNGPGPIAIALTVLLLAAAAFAAWRYTSTHGRTARSASAHEVAIARLDALSGRPVPEADAAAMDAFFVELTDIVRRYLEDRFDVRAPELTTEEFLTAASSSPDLTAEHRKFLQAFLERADMVKFAKLIPSPDDAAETLAVARRFVEETKPAEQQESEAA